jgi:hypothetical protein
MNSECDDMDFFFAFLQKESPAAKFFGAGENRDENRNEQFSKKCIAHGVYTTHKST